MASSYLHLWAQLRLAMWLCSSYIWLSILPLVCCHLCLVGDHRPTARSVAVSRSWVKSSRKTAIILFILLAPRCLNISSSGHSTLECWLYLPLLYLSFLLSLSFCQPRTDFLCSPFSQHRRTKRLDTFTLNYQNIVHASWLHFSLQQSIIFNW